MKNNYDLVIVGGGAAGFYAAVHLAMANSKLKIVILEQSGQILSKVRVSGGGRCNVTSSTFEPTELIKNYPRGDKELLGPFYAHGPEQVVDFFESHGVPLKTEEDGRIFPKSNSSSSIVNCLLDLAKEYKIDIVLSNGVKSISKHNDLWKVESKKEHYIAPKVLIASGSSTVIWKLLESIDIPIIPVVPSLFTFNIKDHRIENLPGISSEAEVTLLDDQIPSKKQLKTKGPVLITHWGLSGPAILKASAFGARIMNEKKYQFKISVNWLAGLDQNRVEKSMDQFKLAQGTKKIHKINPFDLSKRLWQSLCISCEIPEEQQWAQLNSNQREKLISALTQCRFKVDGKSTFKEEFVSSGGVQLDSINFKTMESKVHSGLYFAGEVIDVDAITGGFNFQNAWTTAYLAAMDLAYSQF